MSFSRSGWRVFDLYVRCLTIFLHMEICVGHVMGGLVGGVGDGVGGGCDGGCGALEICGDVVVVGFLLWR